MRSERIDTLQAGRALAALAVVAHHSVQVSRELGGFYIPILEYGWAGVDFFFVLSGFIIALSVQGKSFSDYIWHRVRRVFLPYLPIGLLVAVLYTLRPPSDANIRSWSWITSLTLTPFGKPALSIAWTLQQEMVFYLIFALAWFTKKMWLLVIWAFICLFPTGIIIFKTINIEFLFGVSCFYATRSGFTSKWILASALIPLSIWGAIGFNRDYSILIGLSISLSLPYLLSKNFKVPSILLFFGGASYSIYLAHRLAMGFAARFSNNMFWCFFIAVIGGLAYYFLIERTVLKMVSKTIPIGASEPQEAKSLFVQPTPPSP